MRNHTLQILALFAHAIALSGCMDVRNDLTIASGYNGEVAADILVRLATGNDLVAGGHAYVKDNIKYKYSIPKMTLTDVIQDYAATPAAGGQGTFARTDAVLQPDPYMVYVEFNPRDFEKDWAPFQPSGELVFRDLPANVQSTMLGEVIKKVNEYMGKALLQGNKSTAVGSIGAPFNKFNGLVTKLAAAAGTKIVATPVALTVNNVFTEAKRAWDAIPEAVRGAAGLKMFVSTKTNRLMKESVIAQTYKGQFYNQKVDANFFIDIPVVALTGMANDCIVIAVGTADRTSNLWIGCDVDFSGSNFKVAPLQNNSELYFFKGLFKFDTQIGFPEECVLYKV